MKLKRDSNYELLRIICILMIITGHTLSWGGIARHSAPNIINSINLIYAFILVEVNIFILITGYFQSTCKFKISKIIKLLLTMYFYKVLITLVGYYFGWFELSKLELLWNISPFDFSNYWFLKIYVVLYFLSPFLNKLISAFDKKTFKNLLIIMFIFCSLLVTFTNQELFPNANGYSLVQFVFMYLIGAYIRKYILNNDNLQELRSNNKKRLACLYMSISTFILAFISNYSIYRLSMFLSSKQGILNFIGNKINIVFMNYDNPLVIIGAIGLFLFFGLLSFNSNLINKISCNVLAIYIIHETVLFRPKLYSFFGLNKLNYILSYKIFLKVIIIVFSIFIGASIIEILRKNIVKLLGLIINKINIFNGVINKIKKLENKIDLFMNN